MRSILLAFFLPLAACSGDPGDTPGGDLRVRGEVVLDLTWTAETAGCPYVYDRQSYRLFVQAAGAAAAVTTDDTPAQIQAAAIVEEENRADGEIVLTDEWGVGPTSDQLTSTIATVELHLDFFATGEVGGLVDGTVDWQGDPCVSRYQVDGRFEPVFE